MKPSNGAGCGRVGTFASFLHSLCHGTPLLCSQEADTVDDRCHTASHLSFLCRQVETCLMLEITNIRQRSQHHRDAMSTANHRTTEMVTDMYDTVNMDSSLLSCTTARSLQPGLGRKLVPVFSKENHPALSALLS